jgi:hypothetical protein
MKSDAEGEVWEDEEVYSDMSESNQLDNFPYILQAVVQSQAGETQAEWVALHAPCSREGGQKVMIGQSFDQAPSFPHDLLYSCQTRPVGPWTAPAAWSKAIATVEGMHPLRVAMAGHEEQGRPP